MAISSALTTSFKKELLEAVHNFKLSGGDTTKSKKTIFTIMSLGYSKRIVQRNKCKNGDDIYVTGNVGDSYLGLSLLRKKSFLRILPNWCKASGPPVDTFAGIMR